MKRYLLIGLSLIALAGCETAKGAGEDLETAGDAISDTAEDVQDDL